LAKKHVAGNVFLDRWRRLDFGGAGRNTGIYTKKENLGATAQRFQAEGPECCKTPEQSPFGCR
jgi:hypothetical protein